MTLNVKKLLENIETDVPVSYAHPDSILYALTIGFGQDPLDDKELPYVVETQGQSTVPTMATVLHYPSIFDDCGWDFSRVLHRTQKLELYRPLPTAAEMLTISKVVSVQDRGKTRGAAITMVTEARMKRDDTALYRTESMLIARADGGCGGTGGPAAVHHKLPDREPDMTCDIRTRADQALLYRLCGDFNPLHSDPAMAAAAGFERPILHGLCSYGIACRAVLMTICDYDFTLINGFDARFTAAVFPGETLTTEMWQDRNVVSFRCRAKERNVVVLDNGRCTLAV